MTVIPMAAGITMISGARFCYADCSQVQHKIEDGARGLSSVPRFGGQTHHWYPVAMHCVNASYIVAEEFAYDALMHDLLEGFIGFDPPTPVKHHIPGIKDMENEIQPVLASQFGFRFPLPPEVAQADLEMLVIENKVLRNDGELIGFDKSTVDVSHIEALIDIGVVNLGLVTPSQAESLFLQRYEELRP